MSSVDGPDVSALRDLSEATDHVSRNRLAIWIALACLAISFLFPTAVLVMGDIDNLKFYQDSDPSDLTNDRANSRVEPENQVGSDADDATDTQTDTDEDSPPGAVEDNTAEAPEEEAPEEEAPDANENTGSVNAAPRGVAPPAQHNSVEDLTEHQGQIQFFSALFLFYLIALAVLRAQFRVIRRHASIFWPRKSENSADNIETLDAYLRARRVMPHLNVVSWTILGMIITAVVILVLQNFVLDDLATLRWTSLRDFLWICAILLLGGLLACVIALTAFGTTLASRNYPTLESALLLRDRLEVEFRKLRNMPADDLPPILKDAIESEPDDDGIADFAAHFGGKDGALKGIAPVAREMSAKDLGEIVNILSRAMIVLMVLALVVISLGLASADPLWNGAGEEIRDATHNSYKAWLVVMGTGFTITAGICYVLPIMRLNPYIEAEVNQKSDEIGWDIEFLSGNAVRAKPKKLRRKSIPFPKELTYALGANRAKFVTIMKGTRYGSGFHMVLEQGLWRYLLVIFGLMAPTFAGGLLSLFLPG